MKVGIILITHGNIGMELIHATEEVLKEKTPIQTISVLHSDTPEHYRQLLSETIDEREQGAGVLLLTDLFGATPSNLCLPFLKKDKIELIGGINLPMLIKLSTYPGNPTLRELVDFIAPYGQRNILQVGEDH